MIEAAPRILVVDDDPTVSEVVARYLERDGYAVETVADGRVALDRALAEPPDLVVLDLMLPGVDGLEVCRRLRALAPVPIVILTARGQESDRIVGLDLGADDYVSKPFSTKELVARVRAVLRRARGPLAAAGPDAPRVYVDGDLEVDIAARQARMGGEVISLTAREFELLAFLVRHPRRAFQREELLEGVWGYRYGDASTVTVHVRRLREKVEPDPANPVRIATVWGVGYRWEGAADPPAGGGR
ncbi:MAG TPA: response regulator transcription factor [Acidimicrobiales bacterium]|nr:response regulator transcription factor [Acidimicrobiales bacterium]